MLHSRNQQDAMRFLRLNLVFHCGMNKDKVEHERYKSHPNGAEKLKTATINGYGSKEKGTGNQVTNVCNGQALILKVRSTSLQNYGVLQKGSWSNVVRVSRCLTDSNKFGPAYLANTLTTPSPPAETTRRPSWLQTTLQTPSPRMIR